MFWRFVSHYDTLKVCRASIHDKEAIYGLRLMTLLPETVGHTIGIFVFVVIMHHPDSRDTACIRKDTDATARDELVPPNQSMLQGYFFIKLFMYV